MKFKLNKNELAALNNVVNEAISIMPENHLMHKMMRSMMEQWMVVTATKLITTQEKYSLKMPDHSAICFAIVFGGKPLNAALYEDNLILKMINQIKQHYA